MALFSWLGKRWDGLMSGFERRRATFKQQRLLAHSLLLEEIIAPAAVLKTIFVAFALVLIFVAWASVAEMDEVTHAPGEVMSHLSMQRIQHLEGGILEEIKVQPGEVVKKGQTLARLQKKSVEADREQTRMRELGLRLDLERMQAVLDGRKPYFSQIPDAPELMKEAQYGLWEGQVNARAQQRDVLEEQYRQRDAEVRTLSQQVRDLERSRQLLSQEYDSRRSLSEQGYAPRLQSLDAERRLNDTRTDLNRLNNEIHRAQLGRSEAQERLAEMEADRRRELLAQINATTVELAQLLEVKNKQQDRVDRSEIVSPVSGIVKTVMIDTVGGVIAPGAEIMQIMPTDSNLYVTARIQPRDIGAISVNDPVTIKVSSYDFSRFGGIEGKVSHILPGSFMDERNNPYFKIQVKLEKTYVGVDPAHTIAPGMTVQADVTTGSKTLLQYLFRPVQLIAQQAFSER